MSFYRSSKLRNGKKITVAFTSDEEETDDGRAGGNASDSDDIPILDLIRTVRHDEPIDILTLLEMDEQVNQNKKDSKDSEEDFFRAMELIPRARLTTAFLESNASTHESVFGAIAEIVDNAYDSGSPKLEIDIKSVEENENLQGKNYIYFRDLGCGMTSKEMFNVIAYGYSSKNDNPEMIGMYGNGLKSGSMRVGNDCLVLSIKDDELSALMISQTFIKSSHAGYENENNEVICPLPSWKMVYESDGSVNYRPIYDPSKPEKDEKMRHETEVDLITSYSPFANEETLLEQFYGLESQGTIIILYQLNLNESGEPELNAELDDNDIHDVGDHGNAAKSLKEYLSTLYLKPKMQVFLRGEFIRPTRIYDLMYERRKYNLPKGKFRSTAKSKIADLTEQKKKKLNKIKKVKSEIATLTKEGSTNASSLQQIRKLNMTVDKYESDIRRFDLEIKQKEKISNVTDFTLTLGYNIRERQKSGIRIFSKNRLIVEVEGPEMAKWPLGVLAAVDVPAALMQPSMSKQRFADDREFRTLVKLCQDRAHDYHKRIKIEFEQWCQFGYPTSDPLCERQETQATNRAVEKAQPPFFRCTRDDCGKFRKVNNPDDANPAYFICMDLTDPKYNSCKNAEEVITTKSLEMLPVIKKESRDVEEVAVSPERRKIQRPSAKTSENGNGATTSASGKAPPVIRDAPIQNRGRIISDSEDDEPIVRKRNLRKRRSGHGPVGAEVTSGFDRHRAVIGDSSEEDNSDYGGKSPPPKRRQRKESEENFEERLLELERTVEKEKAARERVEKREKEYMKKLHQTVKNFFPSSWRDKPGLCHKDIDSWNLDEFKEKEEAWRKAYTLDLKDTMARAGKKKVATAKRELLREVFDLIQSTSDQKELIQKIKGVDNKIGEEIKKYSKNK